MYPSKPKSKLYQLQISGRITEAKQQEFLQSVGFFLDRLRKSSVECNLTRDVKDERTYHILEIWQAREDLTAYLDSDSYKALIGAFEVLGKIHMKSLHEIGESRDLLQEQI